MSKITKLGSQKNRQSVYVDDNFVCFLQSFTIFKHKLFEGKEISLSELEKIQLESEKDYAFDLAIRHLSKYTKTEKELKDFLISKGFLPELCELTLQKVKDYRYISDQTYAQNYVGLTKNKYGSARIKQNLKQKGVSEDILNQLEIETDTQNLMILAKKYLNHKEKTEENFQKCAKFLYSRGFDWDCISKIIKELKNNDENWQ